ncbi:MAG: hypothetical protein ACK4NF_00410 [Planctomycetota bacterium]
MLVYHGFKEPPPQIIEEVKKSNPVVQKKIDQLLQEEKTPELPPVTGQQNSKIISDFENANLPDNSPTTSMQAVSEIVEKNKRVTQIIYTFKEFQINYLRYQQATSGDKFPEKGKYLKEVYEGAFQKLLTYTTEEDYKFLIDLALNERRHNVKNYFFTRLSDIHDDIKDKIIIERLSKLSDQDNIIFLLKGLNKKLSPENKERLINVFSLISPTFENAKKEIQNILNNQ